jgi:hypothetical protein
VAFGSLPHHQVLTPRPVDRGPRSGDAQPSGCGTSSPLPVRPKARQPCSAGFVVRAGSRASRRRNAPRSPGWESARGETAWPLDSAGQPNEQLGGGNPVPSAGFASQPIKKTGTELTQASGGGQPGGPFREVPMMNALSLLVALAAIVLFWWPFGTFVFERLTQGRQPPTPWTAHLTEGRGTRDGG